jgi:SRSO17 transposase
MGGRLLEGPTMVGRTLNWEEELGRFLTPFLARLGHKARRQMCPVYVSGLIGPGDRKSIQPMADRLAVGDYDQLHHFIAAGVWDATAVETELLVQADRLVGGSDAMLVIDDTAIPKKGTHSVGVAPQYASALGKTATCQTLVSLTLARGEVPVMLALRLFLPESWTSKRARLERAGVPAEYRTARAHQQLKEELGLDHFEGRSWQGLHRHALMTMIAYAFLQHRRLATARRKKKNQRPAASANFARRAPRNRRTLRSIAAAAMPAMSKMDVHRAAA